MKYLTKQIFLAGLIIISVFFLTAKVFAQDSKLEKYGISFPIAQLGNCQDITSCHAYCDNPLNQEACISFAKAKGFYKEDSLSSKQQEILNQAKQELGCGTIESCKDFCQKAENIDRCSDFAQKHGLSGGKTVDLQKQQILQKAKDILGCDSPDTCKEFCSKSENLQKCSDFAKDSGLKGGVQSPQASSPSQNDNHETPDSTMTPSPTYAPTPNPVSTPTPTPTTTSQQPSNVTLKGSDGSWCYDPLGQNADGNTRMHTYYTCQDASGSHSSYCQSSTVTRSPYCTGTWNGSSWTSVHCDNGGYTCSGSWGNACSNGVCIFSSSTPAPTPTSAPTSLPTATPVGTGTSVQGISINANFIQKLFHFFFN